MTRTVTASRLAVGGTGRIVAHTNVRVIHAGIDDAGWPAVWWESDGPAQPGCNHDLVDLLTVHDGEWHDLTHHHHVATFVHRYRAHHVYAHVTTVLEPMGTMRIVEDTGEAAP